MFQVFYYQETAYPPEDGRFKGHAVWSGDVVRKDASITLQEVLPTFNGTYICQVKNRPDVHGSNGETVLKVVDKGQQNFLIVCCIYSINKSVNENFCRFEEMLVLLASLVHRKVNFEAN